MEKKNDYKVTTVLITPVIARPFSVSRKIEFRNGSWGEGRKLIFRVNRREWQVVGNRIRQMQGNFRIPP